ncbi:MAG: hypothetical protein Q7R22_015225 [Verrucomicrobiota bacterium JB025]|nr:hypothetical protein [Verrucomicrobiota bacterium JB025]
MQSSLSCMVSVMCGGMAVLSSGVMAEAPTAIEISAATVEENSGPNTLVGTLSAIDADEGDAHVFELVAGEGDDTNFGFEIIGEDLYLIYGVSHDYESGPLEMSIRVRAVDSELESYEQVLTISVSDDRGEDADGDGLIESDEEDIHGTSDVLYDTDGDGVGDQVELAAGTSPIDAAEWPDTAVVGWGDSGRSSLAVPATSGLLSISSGQNHSLGLEYDGGVIAWGGEDSFGQISTPAGLTGVVEIAAGGDHWIEDTGHSVALKADGTVVGWGYDCGGDLVVPDGLTGVVSISAGRCHCLALKDDGTVVAWGRNPHGDFGVPDGLSGVVRISAGGFRSLALKDDGTVVVWGSQFDGATWVDASVPAGLSDVVAISAGRFHSLALRQDGTVVAWGYGLNGQTEVPAGLTGVVAVAAGGFHSLALKDDGTVVAWGLGDDGQTTVPASALSGVQAISAGVLHSLAVKQESASPRISSAAVVVGAPNQVLSHQLVVADAVATGYGALGLPSGLVLDPATGLISGTPDGPFRQSVFVWADTDQGRLSQTIWLRIYEGGDPTGIGLVPASVMENSAADVVVGTLTATDPDAGDVHEFELVDGEGGEDNGMFRIDGNQLVLDVGVERDFEEDASGFSILVRTRDGSLNPYDEVLLVEFTDDESEDVDGDGLVESVEEFHGSSDLLYDSDGDGFGDAYEVANGTLPDEADDFPTGRLLLEWGDDFATLDVLGADLSDVVGFGVGGRHCLALKADGSVIGWGEDGDGQLAVPGSLSGAVQVSAGGTHSVALAGDGTVWAWGNDDAGQTTVPVGLADVVRVSAGGAHTLALRDDGSVVAWGDDADGQSTVPAGMGVVVEVAAGGMHSLALRNDGTVAAWGADADGQSSVPAGLEGVVGVAAGGRHSLALTHGGGVVAFGADDFGQCAVPAGLSGVVGVAAGENHSVALKGDGTMVVWGDVSAGQDGVPAETAQVVRFAAGGGRTVALRVAEGFPRIGDVSIVTGWPGEAVMRSFAPVDATASGYSVLGLPDDLALDPVTGEVSGTVVTGERKSVRITAETDEGRLSEVVWVNTADGVAPSEITLDGNAVEENALDGLEVGLLEGLDSNAGDEVMLSLVTADEAPDSYRFEIVDNSSLRLDGDLSADHDRGEVELMIRVRGEDLGGNRIERDFVIQVLDDRTEDDDGDGFDEAFEEDVLATSDLEPDDFTTVDGDGDGVPSLLEHAFNLDATTPGPVVMLEPGADDLAGLPGFELVDDGSGGTVLRMEYIRRVGSWFSYDPLFGGGLSGADWTSAAGLETVTPIDDEWERCVIDDPAPGAGNAGRFGRVGVSW